MGTTIKLQETQQNKKNENNNFVFNFSNEIVSFVVVSSITYSAHSVILQSIQYSSKQ